MNDRNKKQGFSTKAIHAGQQPDPSTGAIMTPIYASSTYVQQSPGVHQGYEYSRSHNPTRKALEDCIAALENGSAGYAFASGMSATATVLELLDSGDHVIAMDDLYGGTYRLFENVRKRSAGLEFTFANLSDLDNLESALQDNTKMIWVESPTNPLLKLVNLQAVAEFARKHNLIAVCDNTFCSPYVQKPLDYGIVVCGPDRQDLVEQMFYLSNAIGSIMSPFDSFLVMRSLKTLSIRMERHCDSAMQVAQYLEQHEAIEKVYYPGLQSHPQHELAKQQMNGFGGMISVVLKGGLASAKTFLENTQLFSLAESLGGVESLIEHPAIMTHASVPEAIRNEIGIVDGLVRLSVGIETLEDLIADIKIALDKI
jgi:cystathionine gamma-lyase